MVSTSYWRRDVNSPTAFRSKLVEAGRIELPSEETDNRELSCFSTFIFVSSSSLGTGEETMTTSLIDLIIAVQTEQL